MADQMTAEDAFDFADEIADASPFSLCHGKDKSVKLSESGKGYYVSAFLFVSFCTTCNGTGGIVGEDGETVTDCDDCEGKGFESPDPNEFAC